jgi:type IV fimbrial biogenesis protein FimT
MQISHTGSSSRRSSGFSIVELVVSVAVLMVLTAIAVPTMMTSIRAYQLNASAMSLSDILKFTRFEAVRQNKPISSIFQQAGGVWTVGTDSNGNATIDNSEKQVNISGFATLLPPGGLPSPSPILAAVSASSLNSSLSGSPGALTFDARGAIRVGGALSTNVFVFYLGNSTHPEFGYRAVVLLPAGSTQIWSAPPSGAWMKIN